jgi:hypothetical protein
VIRKLQQQGLSTPPLPDVIPEALSYRSERAKSSPKSLVHSFDVRGRAMYRCISLRPHDPLTDLPEVSFERLKTLRF